MRSEDSLSGKRIGVFGGTFDPIHIGHLILAVEARHQLRLDQIVLAPAGDPPHKPDSPISPLHHRLAMCRLAIADGNGIGISLIDAERPGPHYTSDMLRLLREKVGAEAKLYFLMGLDSLRDLPTWHEPEWLVHNCRLVALRRHDVKIDWANLEAELPGVRERVIVLEMPELGIASSDLRERVRAGRPIRYQVPREVERYISEQSLYR
ncbi:MAG: nicotinate-nucleotide adenylyltransferase [Caldilineaceae bacterium]|nr:nicotinate-nucleotide adenylyltransferase [Caldilineaceae bacterium]MDE0080343.1 nicotinate-nucleotide adenylyltransferase [Caldilineaceae bacterium]